MSKEYKNKDLFNNSSTPHLLFGKSIIMTHAFRFMLCWISSKNILICVSKMNEGFMDLEQLTWGWVINDISFTFGWTIPLTKQAKHTLLSSVSGNMQISLQWMNEWMNKWCIYIALYCVLLYTLSALQSCGIFAFRNLCLFRNSYRSSGCCSCFSVSRECFHNFD